MSPIWKTCWRSIRGRTIRKRPLVCLDETSKQLIVETRAPIPAKPGRKARHDYEYQRNGVANLFMVFAPLEGWRHVKVSDRHTAIDYAHTLRDLSDLHFPGAAKIVLVQDNLNTHKPASLYEAFPAPEARRLVERFGRVGRDIATSASRSRVEDWRAGLGRSLGSPLSRPFVCECPTISTVPRFQSPPRRTQHADFPHCAPPFASRQRLWDLSCWGNFRPVASHSVGVEQP